ncbi:MAG: hypothetical protein ABIL09_11120 [Gemmatimonadota bacterium]
MIASAILRETPSRNERGQWVARAILDATGEPIVARVASVHGVHVPYQENDRVLVLVPYDDLGAGARVVGLYHEHVEPDDVGNHEIHARAAGSVRIIADDGRVDLGEGAPSKQRPLAMHRRIAMEISNLKDQIDALASLLDPIIAGLGGPPTAASDAVDAVTLSDGIYGGDAATNVFALPTTRAYVVGP